MHLDFYVPQAREYMKVNVTRAKSRCLAFNMTSKVHLHEQVYHVIRGFNTRDATQA